MFRFANPEYLWLLLTLPAMLLIWIACLRHKAKALRQYGDKELVGKLTTGLSKWRPAAKFTLLMAAMAMAILVLARPQMGTKISKEKRNGIETIIAIDVSNSMLAEDVVPSRLQKCKMMVENLIDNFSNDKIGLVVFAGDAFVQLPITCDYVSAKMFLRDISPSLIATQGTDIGRAVELSSKSFTQAEGIGRAIIVITDGEDHEGGAENAVKAAREKGINVFVLGIGSTKGAPIPLGEGNYLTDNTGQTVMTALNEDMCRGIAAAGHGLYIHVDNTNDAQEQLNDEIGKLQRGETENVVYSEYDEQFQAFALIVALLLAIESILLDRKNPRLDKIRLFRR